MSPQRFQISLEDGRVMDWHIDHVRHRVLQPERRLEETDPVPLCPDLDPSEASREPRPDPGAGLVDHPGQSLRHPTRDRHPPEGLMYGTE